jgi:hypothetical protein
MTRAVPLPSADVALVDRSGGRGRRTGAAPRAPRLTAALGVTLVVAVGANGCSLFGASSSTCLDDQACAAGTVCAFGLCVDANDARLATVDVEVEPLVTTALPVQAVFDVDAAAAGGARVDVTLRRAARLAGNTALPSNDAVAVQVSATPRRGIAGRFDVPTVASDDGAWSLALVDGEVYRLAATPLAADTAPVVAARDVTAGTDDAPLLVPCRLADDAAIVDRCPVTVRGRVVAGAGVEARGVPALQARVIDGSGRRLSTLGRTDDDGRFVLGLREQALAVVVELRGSDENAVQPIVRVPVDVSIDAAAVDVDLGEISQGPRADTVRVAGRVLAADGGAARSALVVFRGRVGAGEFLARTTADDDGSFAVALRPGSYAIGAVGALDDEDGLVVEARDVDGAIDDLVLTLGARVPVELQVRSSDGTAIAGASVVLQRVGDALGLAEPVLDAAQPVFLAATDSDGVTAFLVDNGRYRMEVQPPLGSGAPAFSTILVVDGDVERDVVLPDSAVLAGTIVDVDGDANSGSVVRVFSQLTDELGRALFLGEAVSAADGSFTVVVPRLSR